ncbi:hypothetical protein AOC36_01245 [Erysipelothrix larvae]|uniref:TIGR00266 family protein n=1 Tax=Erysipelothrix larvae TaxID=1514105 RepID=A0A0X8GYA6_9FIRM|nr:AIM24 family protein [Erysipelothrix larvae]AMC92664.1 hypothetical protein AOC36_01245 [Erysipelothrix larvae]
MKYRIVGEPLPVAICELEKGEKMFSEVGGRTWVKGPINTETKGGGLGKMMGRMVSGESLFLSYYEAQGPVEIAFASSFPGSIRAYELQAGQSLICQKRAFLGATESVKLEIHMQKKLGAGLVGGEGFILQKITGPGIAFVEIDGHAVDYELQSGEELVCDTGIMAVMDSTCSLEVVSVKGLKNKLLGGEGFFDTVIKGPGTVTLQSITITGLAGVLAPFVAK